jgi:hypothetical protein
VSSHVSLTLSPADLERQRPSLERGAVLAPGLSGLAVGAFCDVELTFPAGRRITLPARVVLADRAGAVLAFEPADRGALAECLGPAEPRAPEEPPPDATTAEPDEEPPAPANVQERLRGLSVIEQLRIAREGNQTERMVLERIYGKVVWEALLRNTHLTVPEVSRLARMGTMPRPLLELIVGNPAWLQAPQVRRALLSNPRLSAEMVQRVLSALPREELKVVPQNTAYPVAVRMAAKAMTRRA